MTTSPVRALLVAWLVAGVVALSGEPPGPGLFPRGRFPPPPRKATPVEVAQSSQTLEGLGFRRDPADATLLNIKGVTFKELRDILGFRDWEVMALAEETGDKAHPTYWSAFTKYGRALIREERGLAEGMPRDRFVVRVTVNTELVPDEAKRPEWRPATKPEMTQRMAALAAMGFRPLSDSDANAVYLRDHVPLGEAKRLLGFGDDAMQPGVADAPGQTRWTALCRFGLVHVVMHEGDRVAGARDDDVPVYLQVYVPYLPYDEAAAALPPEPTAPAPAPGAPVPTPPVPPPQGGKPDGM